MISRFEELRSREVIDMTTGERLGFIDDVELDIETSSVRALVIYGRPRIFGLFGRGDDEIVPCSDIKVIGRDVILIRRESRLLPSESTKTYSADTKTL
ncbi:MAG: YlmC/YmxH family sporulation protein [Ruminococcus sp.]|nr:YlmC/YmxH family sporulation protein [Ruminococcus sp.]